MTIRNGRPEIVSAGPDLGDVQARLLGEPHAKELICDQAGEPLGLWLEDVSGGVRRAVRQRERSLNLDHRQLALRPGEGYAHLTPLIHSQGSLGQLTQQLVEPLRGE
jgi:hypothetical protein